MDPEIEDIDQVMLEQRLCQKTMTIDEQIAPFLLLEPGHFGDDITSNDGRVGPSGFFQRRREDILWHGIDPLSPRVAYYWPDIRKALVGSATHQHCVAGEQLAQTVPQILVVAVLRKCRRDLFY